MKTLRLFFLLAISLAAVEFLSAQEPLAIAPVHRYSFNTPAGAAPEGTQVRDSIGTAHGVIRGADATFDGAGLRLPGGSPGTAAYIDLPNGVASGALNQTPGYASATYEVWVTVHRNLSFSRILDIGSNQLGEVTGVGGTFNGTDCLFVSANVVTNPTIRLERGGVGLTGGATQDIANGTAIGQKMHLVLTYDAVAGRWNLYKNGVLIRTLSTGLGPDTIPDLNVWLGRSNWSGDSNVDATYDEFRIYSYALSTKQILGNYEAGPDTVTSIAPPDGLYEFNESTGTTSVDSNGGKGVTLFGGASFAAGQSGNALSLDGATGYGRVANSSLLNPTTAMSLAVWINPIDWNGNRVIVQKGAGNSQYRLLAENGSLKFEIASPTRAVTAPLPRAGVWSFVVATYDGAWLRLYVDGSEVGKIAATGPIPVTSDDLFIGAAGAGSPASEHFAGEIDDLSIYSRALTPVEIKALLGNLEVTISTPSSSTTVIAGSPANLRLRADVAGGLKGSTGVVWTRVSGPGSVTFSEPNRADTEAKFPLAGTYVLQVAASNTAGSATAQTTVVVTSGSDPSLALWLRFNESTGTTAADGSGTGNVGTLNGGAGWQPEGGMLAGALQLNGATGTYVNVPDANTLDNTGAFTLTYWFRANSATFNGSGLVAKRSGLNNNHSYATYIATDSRMYVDVVGNDNRFSSNTVFSTGAWYHIAVVFNGALTAASRTSLYVNGVLDKAATENATAVPNYPSSFTVGIIDTTTTAFFNGLIDDVRFYRRAMSASEVAAIATPAVGPAVSCGSAPAATSGIAATLNGSVTDEAGGTVATAWSKVSGPGVVTFSDSASTVSDVSFSRAGTYVLRLTATNAYAETFSELTVNVAVNPNIYDDWIESAYPGVTDETTTGPDADPDLDGVSNFTEWALGLSPTAADATEWAAGKAGLPVSGWSSYGPDTYLLLRVRRPIGRTGVTYSAEITGDLEDWQPAVQEGEPAPNGDGSETVTFRDTVPRDQETSRFIRLRLTQP